MEKKSILLSAILLLSSQLLLPIASFAEELVTEPTASASQEQANENTEKTDGSSISDSSDQLLQEDSSADVNQKSSDSTSAEDTHSTETDTSEATANHSTSVPDKSAAYSIDGVTPRVVSQVNSYTMVSLAYSGKGQSLDNLASPSDTITVSLKIVNFSNTEQVIPAGTKINFSASESQGLLTNGKLLKLSTFFSSNKEQNLSATTETDGSVSIIFNSDFYPGENTSQLVLMYQDPGYNWDASGATDNPTIVNIQLASAVKDATSTTAIQSMPLYLQPNKKSDTSSSGSISGFAGPGPSAPSMTSPGYTTDKPGAGGGTLNYIHDPAALDSENKPYFSYTNAINLRVWGRENGGSLRAESYTHPIDVESARLYVLNIDGSIEDITNSPGVDWAVLTPQAVEVRFAGYTQNNPNAKEIYLRTYVPVNSLMDINQAYLITYNSNSGSSGQDINGSYPVTSVFADPLSSSNTPYFRGTDLTVYDTDRTKATDSLYASIGTSPIKDENIIVTDFDGYPDFASTSTGADVTAEPGVYTISYSVTSGGVTTDFTRKITVLKNQTALNVSDSTIYKGSSWSPQDNFANALDKDGNAVTFDKITTSGTVDVNTPGTYTVTYTYGTISKQATITVVENQETLAVKNSTLYTGSSWTAKDNFISATNTSGTAVDFNDVTTTGSVDTTTPGNYEFTYSYGALTKTATVTVLKDQSQIITKDSTIYVGDSWSAKNNFVSATNQDGSALDFSKISVSGTVDTSKTGKNTITYTYNNQKATAQVTVIENKQSLVVKNSTIYVGDSWQNQDNFVSATDKDGNTLDFSAITMTGGVNTNVVGDYTIVYTNGNLRKLAVVTVENNQSLNGSDFTTYIGDPEPTTTDFKATATDKTGKDIEVSLDFSGVDFTKAGTYNVVLTTEDGQTKTVQLTIKDNQQTMDGTDYTMYTGDSEPTAENFKASATDKTGANVTVTADLSQANLTQAGVYPVTLKSEDGQAKEVKLTVLANQQKLTGSDYTMYVGDPAATLADFNAAATDKDGNTLDVTTDLSAIDFTKAGTYDVVLTATDGQTKTVRLIIKDNQQTFTASDYTMYVGDPEPTAAAFKPVALDKDGNSLSVIADFSKVDFSKVGTYDVVLTTSSNLQARTLASDSADPQTLTVKLTIKEKKVTDPTNPDSGATPGTKGGMTTGGTTAKQTLPSTGETSSTIFYFIGTMLTVVASGLFIFRKRAKKIN